MIWSKVSLREILAGIYVNSYQERVSGPGSLDREYVIRAKYPKGTSAEGVREMLRNLLVERFHLVCHLATKQMSTYEIAVGRGGPRLAKSTQEDTAEPERPGASLKSDANGYPISPPGNPYVATTKSGTVRMTFRGATMTLLADRLGYVISQGNGPGSGRVRILDSTGLAGKYDFHLGFESTSLSQEGVAAGAELVTNISAALKKQLGLQLDVTKTTFTWLVVDHIDHDPTPD